MCNICQVAIILNEMVFSTIKMIIIISLSLDMLRQQFVHGPENTSFKLQQGCLNAEKDHY